MELLKKIRNKLGIKTEEEIKKQREIEYIKLQKAVHRAAEGFWDHFLPDAKKEVKDKE